MGGALADDDCAGVEQPVHGGRILLRYVVAVGSRASGRRHAGDVEEVLQTDGYAVERTAVAAGSDLRLRGPGRGKGRLVHNQHERVQNGVKRGDAMKIVAGQLDRGKAPGLYQPPKLGDGLEMQFIGHEPLRLVGCSRGPMTCLAQPSPAGTR